MTFFMSNCLGCSMLKIVLFMVADYAQMKIQNIRILRSKRFFLVPEYEFMLPNARAGNRSMCPATGAYGCHTPKGSRQREPNS